MKTTKRFIAMTAALTLTACMAMPISMMTASAADITITGLTAESPHEFEVYQIFTGDLNDGTFTNLKWGTGIASYTGVSSLTAGGFVPVSVIDDITALTGTDREKAKVVIDKITPSSTKILNSASGSDGKWVNSGTSLSIDDLANGYYLIKDITDLSADDDANSAWIIQVAGDNVEVGIKNAKPGVDKTVADDEGASTTWGESADHDINETFQFKLTATIPKDDDLAAYTSYFLELTDTMSDGVTFESIPEGGIKIDGTAVTSGYTITHKEEGSYTSGAPTDTAGAEWKVTFNNIKTLITSNWGTQAHTVEVVYNAHLNENAVVSKTGGDSIATNNNKVKLTYSNNPDSLGNGTPTTGETPEDYVWVFAYEVDNTKYHTAATEGNELQGATFKLYTDSSCADDKEYKLVWSSAANAYIPTSGTGSAMTSNDDGLFNIKGLDAGTYYLKEISAPATYNVDTNVRTIVISATHGEAAFESAATLDLEGSSNMANAIVNTKNSALPSTGGIGTTLFILGGGCAAGIAGIYLISKKKTREEE